MQRHNSATAYSQAQQTRYPATSSAFSSSALPGEDWTKISDLAERRRIQNRIAQRNYRKKLKKRLEDLERKAATGSASPEQQPTELQRQKSPRKKETPTHSSTVSLDSSRNLSKSESRPGFLPLPDGPLFAEQYTRQLTTSPPPMSYPMTTQDSFSYAPYPPSYSYSSVSSSFSDPTSYTYNPFPATYPPTTSAIEYPTKGDFFPEVDLQSFSFSYATVPSVELTAGPAFDSLPQTPPLSDCHELYIAGSPSDSSLLPQTPAPFEASPRLAMV